MKTRITAIYIGLCTAKDDGIFRACMQYALQNMTSIESHAHVCRIISGIPKTHVLKSVARSSVVVTSIGETRRQRDDTMKQATGLTQ